MTQRTTPSVRAASVHIDVGVATDRAQRAHNEDAVLAADGVYVVADGMGGHESGDVASRTAVETLQALSRGVPDVARARAVLRAAHARLRALPASDELRRPGTTASGVVLSEHDGTPCWLVLNVGDSRTYRMAGGVLEQVTQDHSEIAELVASGVVPPQDAARYPRRNVVTRALGGGSETVDPDVFWLPVSPGDRMLVCSDGLTDELPDSRIEAELKAEADPQAAADRLVGAALAAGGSDNVTVLVVDATLQQRA
ncbi:PP2C family protein-serine/threonine phosphatase [Cellulomonas edaphi]|uniref:Protein phosphatase 2C domain-containing protein n=1 Tax=Cellulomonas edaphi TaxID=3053468 RepID=A0ABT7S9A9_9CELL|nr:protein phosphatase 2C domain-containing protein [Cellulomons edaphi]MDM7832203.1 protein phosphatase 2C domain-containing protein [Cellulomons edaphi]